MAQNSSLFLQFHLVSPKQKFRRRPKYTPSSLSLIQQREERTPNLHKPSPHRSWQVPATGILSSSSNSGRNSPLPLSACCSDSPNYTRTCSEQPAPKISFWFMSRIKVVIKFWLLYVTIVRVIIHAYAPTLR